MLQQQVKCICFGFGLQQSCLCIPFSGVDGSLLLSLGGFNGLVGFLAFLLDHKGSLFGLLFGILLWFH